MLRVAWRCIGTIGIALRCLALPRRALYCRALLGIARAGLVAPAPQRIPPLRRAGRHVGADRPVGVGCRTRPHGDLRPGALCLCGAIVCFGFAWLFPGVKPRVAVHSHAAPAAPFGGWRERALAPIPPVVARRNILTAVPPNQRESAARECQRVAVEVSRRTGQDSERAEAIWRWRC